MPTSVTNLLDARINEPQAAFCALSDRVWDTPETNYLEYQSVAAHKALFGTARISGGNRPGRPTHGGNGRSRRRRTGHRHSRRVRYPTGPEPTGRLSPNPARKATAATVTAAAITCWAPAPLAATAVKDMLAALGIKGRVRYYGCPAEEGGSSKGFMVHAGGFDDVDIAISWHPAAFTGVNNPIFRWPVTS